MTKGVAMVESGKVAGDLLCMQCGYNLRTLPGDGRCPECGVAVGQTIDHAAWQTRWHFGWVAMGAAAVACGAVLVNGHLAMDFHCEPYFSISFIFDDPKYNVVGAALLGVGVPILCAAQGKTRRRSVGMRVCVYAAFAAFIILYAYYRRDRRDPWLEDYYWRPRAAGLKVAVAWDALMLVLLGAAWPFLRQFAAEARQGRFARVAKWVLLVGAAGPASDLLIRVLRAAISHYPTWVVGEETYNMAYVNMWISFSTGAVQGLFWALVAVMAFVAWIRMHVPWLQRDLVVLDWFG